jgi:hypothetical protein
MRRLVIAAVLGLLAVESQPAFAQFYGPGPWCAVVDRGFGSVYWDCRYRSLAECRPNVLAVIAGFATATRALSRRSDGPKTDNVPNDRLASALANGTTAAVRSTSELLDDDAATITSKAIELAKNGELTALRLCLERIIPPRKDRPVNFDMPEIKTPSDALLAATAIVRAVAGGDLTPSEAAELSKAVDSFARIAETADLAERIKRLEQMANNS